MADSLLNNRPTDVGDAVLVLDNVGVDAALLIAV
jgi:hypothetical protein